MIHKVMYKWSRSILHLINKIYVTQNSIPVRWQEGEPGLSTDRGGPPEKHPEKIGESSKSPLNQ